MDQKTSELTDAEIEELDGILARVEGGAVPNTEALDGFFAALACCPDLIMPSEYLPVIQSGETEEGDLVFQNIEEAQLFTNLIAQHWNHVNAQLNGGEVYLPLLLADDNGNYRGNDWARGFLVGTEMRREIWADVIDDDERGGNIIPIFGLAYEDHPDPEIRPFKEPIDDEKRQNLIAAAAAGVMRMHRDFLGERQDYEQKTRTYVRPQPKTGRNAPCPCGSGRKYKHCCGREQTLH